MPSARYRSATCLCACGDGLTARAVNAAASCRSLCSTPATDSVLWTTPMVPGRPAPALHAATGTTHRARVTASRSKVSVFATETAATASDVEHQEHARHDDQADSQ